MPETDAAYEILRKDDGIWHRKAGDGELLVCLGPTADGEAIKEAMADWLGAEDFGE